MVSMLLVAVSLMTCNSGLLQPLHEPLLGEAGILLALGPCYKEAKESF